MKGFRVYLTPPSATPVPRLMTPSLIRGRIPTIQISTAKIWNFEFPAKIWNFEFSRQNLKFWISRQNTNWKFEFSRQNLKIWIFLKISRQNLKILNFPAKIGKFEFPAKIWNFEFSRQNLKFWKISRQNLKIWISRQNLNFPAKKIQKFWNFDRNLNFPQKFENSKIFFSRKILKLWPKFEFPAKILKFWPKFEFPAKNVEILTGIWILKLLQNYSQIFILKLQSKS